MAPYTSILVTSKLTVKYSCFCTRDVLSYLARNVFVKHQIIILATNLAQHASICCIYIQKNDTYKEVLFIWMYILFTHNVVNNVRDNQSLPCAIGVSKTEVQILPDRLLSMSKNTIGETHQTARFDSWTIYNIYLKIYNLKIFLDNIYNIYLKICAEPSVGEADSHLSVFLTPCIFNLT